MTAPDTPRDYCKPGEVVKIDPRFFCQHVRMADNVRYDYTKSRTTCPACGALGIPWGGWFHGECDHLAVVETGEMFERTDVPAGAFVP